MSKFKRRLASAAVVVCGLASIGLVTAGPASAALSDCSGSRFCLFQFTDGSGKYVEMTKGTSNFGSPDVFDGVFNDKASYVWNRREEPWCVYQHKNEGGHSMMIRPGRKAPLTVTDPRDGFYWDNKISSTRPAIHIIPPRNPQADTYICQGDWIIY